MPRARAARASLVAALPPDVSAEYKRESLVLSKVRAVSRSSCERRPNGRWSATVELESATAAAHAVGCRQLLIKERAVTAEPVGAGEAEEGGAQKKQRVE